MSANGYRQLAWLLGFVCLCLLIALGNATRKYRQVSLKFSTVRNDFRYAHDIVHRFEADRDFALKGNITNAVECLYKLQAPPRPFNNPAADFVERARKRAVKDVISFLRLKTGKDMGEEPEPWILEYGDDNLKMNQERRFETWEEIEEVSKGNYKELIKRLGTNR